MIARVWRGSVRAADANAYEHYMRQVAVPGYREIAGNRGGYFLRRTVGDREEFCMFTFWDSMEAIRGFAGNDPDAAVFYPQDDAYLISRDERVTHFTVYEVLD